jgi:hypothetical protein
LNHLQYSDIPNSNQSCLPLIWIPTQKKCTMFFTKQVHAVVSWQSRPLSRFLYTFKNVMIWLTVYNKDRHAAKSITFKKSPGDCTLHPMVGAVWASRKNTDGDTWGNFYETEANSEDGACLLTYSNQNWHTHTPYVQNHSRGFTPQRLCTGLVLTIP